MACGALVHVGCLAILAGFTDVPRDLEGLDSPARIERELAASRLRAELSVKDLDACFSAARTASPRKRGAILEVLLDRSDLARVALTRPSSEHENAFLDDLVRAAFVRSRSDAEEPGADAASTWDRLHRALGDTDALLGSGATLDLDALAYEAARARVLPFPIVVDPSAPDVSVAIPRRVLSAETLILGALLQSGVPISACGAARFGDRSLPVFALLGGRSDLRGGERAVEWMHAWRTGSSLAAVRAGTALLTLAVAPLDAAVVSEVRAGGERAGRAFEIVGAVPARGAECLAGDAGALTAFVGLAARGDGPMPVRARRVLDVLPRRDDLDRDVDALLVASLENASQPRRAGLLASLARRRARGAAPAFRAHARDDDPAMRAAALQGLHALGDPEAPKAALDALSRRDDAETLQAAVSTVAARTETAGSAATLVDGAPDARRAAVVEAMLRSRDPVLIRRAIDGIGAIREPDAIRSIVASVKSIGGEPGSGALRDAFAAAIPDAPVPTRIVAAIAGFVPEADRDSVRAAIERDATPELLELRFRAVASLEPVARAVDRLVVRVEDPVESSSVRLVALRALREFLLDRPPFERASTRESITKRMEKTHERARREGNSAEMEAIVLAMSDRADPFPRPDDWDTSRER